MTRLRHRSDASVYVDGYFAGTVDEFDGAFQRLRVVPGQHEIVVYLEGYRSIREKLYLQTSNFAVHSFAVTSS